MVVVVVVEVGGDIVCTAVATAAVVKEVAAIDYRVLVHREHAAVLHFRENIDGREASGSSHC